ncbi:MAG: NADH-quinone oxidoreductase subunit NuoH, partial [Anaerolineae bacterium]|nr:NADH-quinone oxidoreductase subunit NuoH [Anaerolineae bacterium]
MGFLDFIKDLFVNIGLWFQGLVASTGLPDFWVRVINLGVGALVLGSVPLVAMFFLIWYERKIVARIGDRLGPNNSGAYGGPYGLLQVPADAIKMFTKEDVLPENADRWVFNIAPMLAMAVAVLVWAVIPLGKGIIGSDLSIGVFYILALGSGMMVAVLMAGWSSNNKYALVAALRGIATLVSYEIPQILAIMAIVIVAGSLSLQDITGAQEVWFLVAMPLTAFIFLCSVLSELGRRPFDLVEADSEIVAGYFIEYSGMKFGMFYLAEFMNQLMISVLFATLFLGGWRGPFVDQVPVLSTLWLVIKVFIAMFVIQLLQYSLPRLRIDQILAFNWKFLTPLALVNVCVIALVGKVIPPGSGPWVRAGWLLLANLAVALVV